MSMRRASPSIRRRSSQEDIASTSARASERSRQLREQHIAHRIERAARETQRGEEAAARKRRRENLCAAIQSYGEEHSLSSRESVTESIASGGKPVVQELAVASKLKRETDQARVEALANENHPLAGAAVRKVGSFHANGWHMRLRRAADASHAFPLRPAPVTPSALVTMACVRARVCIRVSRCSWRPRLRRLAMYSRSTGRGRRP